VDVFTVAVFSVDHFSMDVFFRGRFYRIPPGPSVPAPVNAYSLNRIYCKQLHHTFVVIWNECRYYVCAN